jgi:hypothetical protein
MGSAFVLAFPALAVGALHVAGAQEGPDAAAGLAVGAGLGAAVLALTVIVAGPPGALGAMRIAGIGGLHVTMVAACAAFAGLIRLAPLLRAGAPSTARRAGEVVLAVAVPALATLGVSAGVREGAAFGIVALLAGDPWYAQIFEFQPLVGSGVHPLASELAFVVGELGALPVMAFVGAVEVRRRWTRQPGSKARLLVTTTWAAALFALTVLRTRFGYYAILPLGAVAALGALRLAARATRWRRAWRGGFRAVAWGVVVLPAIPYVVGATSSIVSPGMIAALEWLRTAPDPDGRPGVMANWDIGHAVQYYADKPSVASPFGTTLDVGERALRDAAAFYYATEEDDAERALASARVGFVVLTAPSAQLVSLAAYAPPGAPQVFTDERSLLRGRAIRPTPAVDRLIVERLHRRDGCGDPAVGEAALGMFALTYDSEVQPGDRHPEVRIFRWVPGAAVRVSVGRPGVPLRATVSLRTRTGRQLDWVASAVTGPEGVASFRVPYATGANGTTAATAVRVTSGEAAESILVPPRAVEDGQSLDARLALRVDVATRSSGSR